MRKKKEDVREARTTAAAQYYLVLPGTVSILLVKVRRMVVYATMAQIYTLQALRTEQLRI